VLTGFLGSGKNALLKRILTTSSVARIGVPVNKFGGIGIDARMIASREGGVVELTNGCVCCTVRDGLLEVVAMLLDRPAPPDHPVVETPGLADPVPPGPAGGVRGSGEVHKDRIEALRGVGVGVRQTTIPPTMICIRAIIAITAKKRRAGSGSAADSSLQLPEGVRADQVGSA
jgi:hypothetical protein